MCANDDLGLDPTLADGLAELPADRAAVLVAAARRFAALSQAEQAAVAAAALAETLDQQAEQVVEAALDAVRRGRVPALLPRLDEMSASFACGQNMAACGQNMAACGQNMAACGQAKASLYAELARFVDCVAALLSNRPPPGDVPGCYAQRYAQLASAINLRAEGRP